MRPEIIIMLTHHDVTVKNAHEVFEQCKDIEEVKYWGFKNVGLPKDEMKALTAAMKAAGKTTFLKLVSGILLPTRGRVLYGDTEVSALSEPRRDRWRGRHVGFLFQDFRLFDGLTALENVLLPFTFCSRTVSNTQRRDATDLLKLHGVNPDTRSELLSRGEMQRTALVRVLMQSPSIILADEPTASLDANRAGHAVDALISAAGSLGASLVLVSHDERVLGHFERHLTLADGRLTPRI